MPAAPPVHRRKHLRRPFRQRRLGRRLGGFGRCATALQTVDKLIAELVDEAQPALGVALYPQLALVDGRVTCSAQTCAPRSAMSASLAPWRQVMHLYKAPPATRSTAPTVLGEHCAAYRGGDFTAKAFLPAFGVEVDHLGAAAEPA